MTQQKVPHKHAALIKQWADGAEIQWYNNVTDEWSSTGFHAPCWDKTTKYRVKPEPDIVRYRFMCLDQSTYPTKCRTPVDNIMLVFDGETGELKDAQLLAKE